MMMMMIIMMTIIIIIIMIIIMEGNQEHFGVHYYLKTVLLGTALKSPWSVRWLMLPSEKGQCLQQCC